MQNTNKHRGFAKVWGGKGVSRIYDGCDFPYFSYESRLESHWRNQHLLHHQTPIH